MKIEQSMREITEITLTLILTEQENDQLFAELENLKLPDSSRTMLKQLHRNMFRSTNVPLKTFLEK